jgi:general stress protein YciG
MTTTKPTQEKDPRRVAAGRKGGHTTRDRYGTEFYSKVGKAGGRKGGTTTRDRHGLDHYRRIGAIGGSASRTRNPNRGSR